MPSRPRGQLMRRRGGLVRAGLEGSPPRTRLLALKLRLPSRPRRRGLEAPRAGPGDLHSSLDSGVYSPSSPAHWSWLLLGAPARCPSADSPYEGAQPLPDGRTHPSALRHLLRFSRHSQHLTALPREALGLLVRQWREAA